MMKTIRLAAMATAMSVVALSGAGVAVASNDPAATGRLMVVDGGVLVQRAVQTDIARVGTVIGVGDAVVTTDTGTAQWDMADDSIFAMAPDSGLKINHYVMPGANNPSGAASYTLLQGAVHTITGKIGRQVAAGAPRNVFARTGNGFNPANLIKVVAAPSGPYLMKTALAMITTKGADYAAVQSDKLLQVVVNSGAVEVCTVAGCASPGAGEGVLVNCVGCKPQVVPGASLGLDSVLASVAFKSQNNEFSSQVNVDNPRVEPKCNTVAGQAADGSCIVTPNPPVSPN